MKTFHIYTLSNPKNCEVFYVGCTVNLAQRMYQHLSITKTHHWEKRKPSVMCTGKENYMIHHRIIPVIEVVDTIITDNQKEAFAIEEYWIQQFRAWGFPIMNFKGIGGMFWDYKTRLKGVKLAS